MSNGFILAFSGPKGTPVPQRLSVDFRQGVFSAGQNYATRLGGGGVLAQGISPSVLAIPLSRAFRPRDSMALDVEGNAFTFALPGLPEMFADFSACRDAPKPVPEPMKKPMLGPKPKNPKPIVVDSSKTNRANTPKPDFAPESLARNVAAAQGAPQTVALRRDIEALSAKNLRLEKTLEAVRADLAAAKRRGGLGGKDWSLEEASARYEESERQVRRLGEQIERERLACQKDKEDLEALLFDPAVTEQRQLAKLADLERQLEETKAEAERARARYEAKIAALERQLAGAPR